MAKKNLKDQIEQVSFWYVCGIFWYLVIAFFLKSKYPISEYAFDLVTAYDVVKDALTLAAAFLAPVAAFVLFSDWRSEHKGKSTLQLSSELGGLVFEIKNGLGFYNAKIIEEKVVITGEFRGKEDRQNLLWQLIELKRTGGRLLVKNNEIDALKALTDTFHELANEVLNNLHFQDYFKYQLKCEKNGTTSNDNHKNYLKYTESFNEKFTKLEKLSEEIDQKVVDAQKSLL